jgi:hypothetical protein
MIIYVRSSDLEAFEQLAESAIPPGLDVHLLADGAPLTPAAGAAIPVAVEASVELPTVLLALEGQGQLSFVRLETDRLGEIRRKFGC